MKEAEAMTIKIQAKEAEVAKARGANGSGESD